jgi:hypothetical protein
MSTTAGIWTDEKDAAEAFDRLVEPSGFFRFYREVRGTLIQPRPCQQDKSVRIDRLLIPTAKLNGWTYGCIGVEFKRSGTKIGRPISQMLDYSRALWQLPNGGINVALGWTFLWPAQKEHGDMAGIFAQQRIGTACPNYGGVTFFAGEVRVLNLAPDGTFQIGKCDIGESVGSR